MWMLLQHSYSSYRGRREEHSAYLRHPWRRKVCYRANGIVVSVSYANAWVYDKLKYFYSNKQEESVYQLAISCLAFVPLKSIIPESKAKELIGRLRLRIEKRGESLSAGLKEQYDIQLRLLESNLAADIEITHIPSFISNVGMYEVKLLLIAIPYS